MNVEYIVLALHNEPFCGERHQSDNYLLFSFKKLLQAPQKYPNYTNIRLTKSEFGEEFKGIYANGAGTDAFRPTCYDKFQHSHNSNLCEFECNAFFFLFQ